MKNFESKEPCVCCNFYAERMVTYHHILTRKAYLEYSFSNWNMLSLCLLHHNQIHSKGLGFMADNYKSVKNWLLIHGWSYDEFFKEWVKPDDA